MLGYTSYFASYLVAPIIRFANWLDRNNALSSADITLTMLPMSDTPSYSQIACIGTGLSAIALGATLQRWYGFEDIRFFDRHPASGGTWYTNSYPG